LPSINMNVFTFCTSGSGEFEKKHLISKKLSEKGYKVIGEFSCSGEFSPLGFNLDKKGHPDERDMESAGMFAKDLLNL
jgi:flavodoxin